MNKKGNQNTVPHLNSACKANQRNSGSDDRQNYHSSSSQEIESPDSQRANHQSNHHPSFVSQSSSPSQLDNPVARNHNSAEFNANLSIDPKEVIPINKVHESPVKPNDRFTLPLKENMFRAVKQTEINVQGASNVLNLCENLNLRPTHYPEYVKHYHDAELKSKGQITRNSINGKTEKNKDPTHMPNRLHNSHNIPSTSQQGARESSRSCPESKYDKRKLHIELTQSQPFHDGKNLSTTSQQGAEEGAGFKYGNIRKHGEKFLSIIESNELKGKQQCTQDNKKLSSKPQLGGIESTRTCIASTHEEKKKHFGSSQSVLKSDGEELARVPTHNEQLSRSSKSKHMLRTEYVAKGKESKGEQQLTQSRIQKGKETAHSAAKAYEFKDGYQTSQPKKLLDPRRIFEFAAEPRNRDKNQIKKRDSPEDSAMASITSSKKERTSLYHGGRKSEISRLKDLCVHSLIKGIKQTADPTKYINRNASFEVLEPVLVLISPDKIQKIEDKYRNLKNYTNGIWRFCCEKKFKSQIHLKDKDENWHAFYQRCCIESEEKLRHLTASISASASKAKPDRQIKFTTVDGPPTKRPKVDNAMVKNHVTNTAIKPLPNPFQPSHSRSDAPVPLKGLSNHIKSSQKTMKKDAPLMHKAKKTLGQIHRIHKN